MIDINIVLKTCKQVAEKAFKKEFKTMVEEGPKYQVMDGKRVVDYMYDVCGFASIRFSDKRNVVYREYKKYRRSMGDMDTINSFYDYPIFGRQELRIQKVIAYAVSDYLNSLGAKTYVVSRID